MLFVSRYGARLAEERRKKRLAEKKRRRRKKMNNFGLSTVSGLPLKNSYYMLLLILKTGASSMYL